MKNSILFILIILAGIGCFYATIYAIDKQIVYECNRHNVRAEQIERYWVTQQEKDTCYQVGVEVNAITK